jgi:hypothetical protein
MGSAMSQYRDRVLFPPAFIVGAIERVGDLLLEFDGENQARAPDFVAGAWDPCSRLCGVAARAVAAENRVLRAESRMIPDPYDFLPKLD